MISFSEAVYYRISITDLQELARKELECPSLRLEIDEYGYAERFAFIQVPGDYDDVVVQESIRDGKCYYLDIPDLMQHLHKIGVIVPGDYMVKAI